MGRNDSDSVPITSCLPIHFLIDCIAVGTGNGLERHTSRLVLSMWKAAQVGNKKWNEERAILPGVGRDG